MNNIKLTLSIDAKAHSGMDALPRSVSVSALLRVMLKAISMSEHEFEKYKASSKEAQEVRDYLREKARMKNITRLMM